ncbi:toxin-antitoxin system HicB family antitoxin [Melaminivora suipulveris]|uniref:Toxin-antitoxin system HicB family antitoxin n=1 Tax=Melaminivora suipulveris TaxID=2109913 RepID=A0A2R3QE38_9BURK|nr:type II toxin-antitoxin system HicB family antitoxin [Melaminivora suipulveris]AVO50056.1 toxin-antitoxin system HicB family antitoxin [Melaminivora suipulveris]
MSKMTYRGYTAHIQYDDRDSVLVGRVRGIGDIIGFHADTVASLRVAFHEAVDDYLSSCEKLGKEPQCAASGKMMLRVAPEVHRAALIASQAAGTSLNQWAERVLSEAAHAD